MVSLFTSMYPFTSAHSYGIVKGTNGNVSKFRHIVFWTPIPSIYVDLCNHCRKGGFYLVHEQRKALDEIFVTIRAVRTIRRTFFERDISIGLTSSVAGLLLEARSGCCGGSSG